MSTSLKSASLESASLKSKVNWFEVAGDDVEGLTSFYGQVFGWEPSDAGGVGYHQVTPSEEGISGGIWAGPQKGKPYAVFYIEVEGVEKAVARAEEAGAKVVLPVSINGPVRYAHIQDPAGNRIGIYEPLAEA